MCCDDNEGFGMKLGSGGGAIGSIYMTMRSESGKAMVRFRSERSISVAIVLLLID
jgi:hypothetical protein